MKEHAREQQLNQKRINWPELENQLLMHTFKRVPLTLVRGRNAYVWDEHGNKYLDFVGGWAVNSLGHCHPVLTAAIKKQVDILIQTSNQFYTIPQLELAQLLVKNSCLDKIFFCNSGAEANEGAVKLARRYGKLNLNGAYEIITTYGSFHGRTLAMVAATGQSKFQEPFIPLPNGFVNVEYNSIQAIKTATNKNTCAVMVEPIQGEGGVNLPAKSFLAKIRQWCNDKGILMILDEVQTGIGRIGALFGYQRFNVEPDIMTLAKGLGGGIPIGAILAKERAAVFIPGEHGSTFGGNPLSCAASLAVLKYIIENDIPSKVDSLGSYFLLKLKGLQKEVKSIIDVRGLGLLIGVVLDNNVAERVVLKCIEKGLLVNAVKPNIIRFIPPLLVTKKQVDSAINIFTEVLNTE